MLRVGIDVGGTHTDAVLLDGDEVISWTKVLTSQDVQSGVMDSLEQVLQDRPGTKASIAAVMLGTTQFTNAVVQRSDLTEVAAIRIGLPSGQGLPPKSGWPEDISRALGNSIYMMRGGYLYDGSPLAPMDETEIDHVIADLKTKKIGAVAVSSTFSPANPEPEIHMRERIAAALPDVHVTLSHRVSGMGILERENAALLNASLLPFADGVVRSFVSAVRGRGLDCQFFVSQNDGTLMGADFARHFPALTFASGPTNSLRGASKLTGLKDAIVVDVGGTTSDIGVLRDGFPRESNVVIEVGGVRTNFRMPDVLALGLGGGSVVRENGHVVGPQSVGHQLVKEGLVFGGATLTATDVVVAAGLAEIGDPERVADVDAKLIARSRQTMASMLSQSIDRMRPSRDSLPVVLVGGGSILAQDALPDAYRVYTPKYSQVANAIGAAIAQIGGEAERIVSYERIGRERAIRQVTQEANETAISAGADGGALRVADIEETAISYMAGATTRLRVKVVGDIKGVAG